MGIIKHKMGIIEHKWKKYSSLLYSLTNLNDVSYLHFSFVLSSIPISLHHVSARYSCTNILEANVICHYGKAGC